MVQSWKGCVGLPPRVRIPFTPYFNRENPPKIKLYNNIFFNSFSFI